MKKLLILVFAVLYSTFLSISAQNFNNSGFQQLKIGDINAIVLSDGYYPVSSVQPFIAPAINPKLVNKELFAHHLPETNLRLAINVLLLKIRDHLVLIDAGAGQEIGPSGGWLADNLKLIGISPDLITDIVTTHVHLDHTGGLIDENGKSKYPNAAIYISKDEYQFWEDGYPDFSKSKIEDESIKSEINIFANRILNTIKPQIQLVQDGDIILDHIKINLAPGHTGGHYITTIFSNGESIVHIADLIHVGEILFTHPEWGNGLDFNFDLGVKTRLDVLKNLKDKDALIIGAHLAYPGIGHIKEIKKNSYEWEPTYFSTPQIRE